MRCFSNLRSVPFFNQDPSVSCLSVSLFHPVVSKTPCEKLISKGSLSLGSSALLPAQTGSRENMPMLNTKILYPSKGTSSHQLCTEGPQFPNPKSTPTPLDTIVHCSAVRLVLFEVGSIIKNKSQFSISFLNKCTMHYVG